MHYSLIQNNVYFFFNTEKIKKFSTKTIFLAGVGLRMRSTISVTIDGGSVGYLRAIPEMSPVAMLPGKLVYNDHTKLKGTFHRNLLVKAGCLFPKLLINIHKLL